LNWVFFGLGALLGPQFVIPNDLDNALALVFLRQMGAAAVVIGLLAWFTRSSTDTNVRRQNTLLLFLAATLSAVISAFAVSAGTLPSSDWLFVGIDVLFALAFAYFRFIKTG
ncbi:MAG: hypothetical protein OEV06_10930, partial [Anaerolineae bacterium]|nr:hypothetical protein [Anaerolineae bacterium]